MKKKAVDPCEGCIWANRISDRRVFCPFPQCVRGKLSPGGSRKDRDDEHQRSQGVDC